MRLLNATTSPLQFEVFYRNPPPYAILSHTWGSENEEVTFQDVRSRDRAGKRKLGYQKIKACCDRAVRDGLRYVWIDTCCIDKTNSVELQEAIHSMFNWYKRSTICYAYLFDYAVGGRALDVEAFEASKWFTRGWTLQELIAPVKVLFYSRDWVSVGSKTELGDLISSITRVSTEVLAGQDLEHSSVAQRMSWASMRTTTRAEDIAYCLLGIFNVTMPMMYGEGGVEAFLRLQKAIMEQSDDHTLFAWKQHQGFAGHGLLATSPSLFTESSTLIRSHDASSRTAYRMSNRALEIQLRLTSTLQGGDLIALLGCRDQDESSTLIGIYIAVMPDGRCIRTCLDQLARIGSLHDENYRLPALETIYVPQLYLPEKPPQQAYVFRFAKPDPPNWKYKINSALFNASGAAGVGVAAITMLLGSFRPFWSASTTGLMLAASTSRGSSQQGTLDYTLMAGGRAAVLLSPWSASESFLVLSWDVAVQYIAVVFGVNLDGSIYGDIIEIAPGDSTEIIDKMRRELRYLDEEDSATQQVSKAEASKWFERYVLQRSEDASTKNIEKEIWDIIFSLKIEQKLVDERLVYQVCLGYRQKG